MRDLINGIKHGEWEENIALFVGIVLNLITNTVLLSSAGLIWYFAVPLSVVLQVVFIAFQRYVLDVIAVNKYHRDSSWSVMLLYGLIIFGIDSWVNYEGIDVIITYFNGAIPDPIVWVIAVLIAVLPDIVALHLKQSYISKLEAMKTASMKNTNQQQKQGKQNNIHQRQMSVVEEYQLANRLAAQNAGKRQGRQPPQEELDDFNNQVMR